MAAAAPPLFDPSLFGGAPGGIPPGAPAGGLGPAPTTPPPVTSEPTGQGFNVLTPAKNVVVPGEQTQFRRSLPTEELIHMLNAYIDEAREARQSGPESREDIWRLNWDSFWSRRDMSEKEEWQHDAQMPEVANFVERSAAELSALLISGGDWHEVSDDLDPQRQISNLVHRIMKVILGRCAINKTGHRVGFPRVLRDVLKSGLMANMCLSVTNANGGPLVEYVDPLEIFLDPTGRGLYRIREMEIDKHALQRKKGERHADGTPIWNAAAIDRLTASVEPEQRWDKYLNQGHGHAEGSGMQFRKTYPIHEFLCTILDREGNLIADNQVVYMGNRREIIRGPEPNPFWHQRDWLVYESMISVPGSTYGRTDVENFRGLADSFIDLTNMLMDSVGTSSMRAFMLWPEALENPEQIDEGVSPNKMFIADEAWPAGQEFLKSVELGRLPPEAFQAWSAMKRELMEAAGQNELQLGGLANKSDTTATEINRATAGASALKKARASDIEEGLLDPMLSLIWWTAIQGFDPERDSDLAAELGPALSQMIVAQRAEFRSRRFRHRSRAISSALERGERLQGLLGFLNVAASSPHLASAFVQDFSLSQLIRVLLHDFGIDPDTLKKTERELLRERVTAMQGAAQGAIAPGANPASPKSLNPTAPSAPGLSAAA